MDEQLLIWSKENHEKSQWYHTNWKQEWGSHALGHLASELDSKMKRAGFTSGSVAFFMSQDTVSGPFYLLCASNLIDIM
jgi:hypothetical protein